MSWSRRRDETTEHSYFEERLSAYIDGELAPRERETVEQHLATCPACRWDLSTLRQAVQWTSELPTVQVPRMFTIPAPVEPARAARRRWTLLPVLQGATALVALLLVFAVAGDAMLTGFAPRSESELTAIQMPAPVVETTVVEAEVAEKQVEVTVVVEQEGPVEPAAAAALPEDQPSEEPQEEGPAMLQMAPSEEMTATGTASADTGEAQEVPAGGGMRGTDGATAGTPLPPAAEVVAPTPSPQPSLEAPATQAAAAPPTSEVLAYQSSEAAEGETQPVEAREMAAPAVEWLRIAEYSLGVALILLVGTTLALVVWRRMMG